MIFEKENNLIELGVHEKGGYYQATPQDQILPASFAVDIFSIVLCVFSNGLKSLG